MWLPLRGRRSSCWAFTFSGVGGGGIMQAAFVPPCEAALPLEIWERGAVAGAGVALCS